MKRRKSRLGKAIITIKAGATLVDLVTGFATTRRKARAGVAVWARTGVRKVVPGFWWREKDRLYWVAKADAEKVEWLPREKVDPLELARQQAELFQGMGESPRLQVKGEEYAPGGRGGVDWEDVFRKRVRTKKGFSRGGKGRGKRK